MFTNGTHDFMYYITTPPGSMLFILFLAILIAVTSTGLTKLLVDTDELNRKQIMIKAHQEEKDAILKMAEEDPAKYRKRRKRWERKEVMLKQTQQKMALSRLKPTCITFLPMIIIFSVIRGLFNNNPVAITAMNAWDIPMLGGVVQAFTGDAWDAATKTLTNPVVWDWTALVYGSKSLILSVLNLFSKIFPDIAIPTPFANPCPSGPVVVSTPGVTPYSGCPGVLLSHCLKFLSSSSDKSNPPK